MMSPLPLPRPAHPNTASHLAVPYLSSKSQCVACSAELSFIFLSAGGCSPPVAASNLLLRRVVLGSAAWGSPKGLLEVQGPRPPPSPAVSAAAL